jgi:hypothetical protein
VSYKLEGHNVRGLKDDLLLRRNLAVRHPGRQCGHQICRMVVIADVNLHDSHVLPLVKWRGVWLCVGGSVAEVEKPGINVIGRTFPKEVWYIITLAT